MKIKKLINLQKQYDVVGDREKLSLGSLYFIGEFTNIGGGSGVIAMPISIKEDVVSLYVITSYEYNLVKSSNKSVVIIPFGIHSLLAKIVKIFNIRINKKIANTIFNSFAERITYSENIITARIKRSNIEFMDNVILLSINEMYKLRLHLIKRITDISKWPGLAIKKWAMHHLELNDESIKYIYSGSKFRLDKKELVNILQKHGTYNAGKKHHINKNYEEIVCSENNFGLYSENIPIRNPIGQYIDTTSMGDTIASYTNVITSDRIDEDILF